MAKIKVNTNGVNDIKIKVNSIKSKNADCISSVSSIRNGLDWQVKAKSNINTRLSNVQNRLNKQNERLNAYVIVLNSVINNFGSTDRQLKQNAKGIIYQLNQIIAQSNSVETAISKIDFEIDDKLRKILETNDLFGALNGVSATSLIALGNLLTNSSFKQMISSGIWDASKSIRDIFGGFKDVSDLVDVFADDELVKKYLGWIGDVKNSDVLKIVGYGKDTEKLIKAIKNGDIDDIVELGEKYVKKELGKVAKTTYGVSGFASTGYINLGWNFAENILDIDKFANPITSSDSTIVGLGKYVWHCTGGTLLETGSEMAYDMVEDVGKLANYDVNKIYKDLTGKEGVEGFYKAFTNLGDELFGDYYDSTKSSGVLKGTATLVGDSLSWWGDKIAGLF